MLLLYIFLKILIRVSYEIQKIWLEHWTFQLLCLKYYLGTLSVQDGKASLNAVYQPVISKANNTDSAISPADSKSSIKYTLTIVTTCRVTSRYVVEN